MDADSTIRSLRQALAVSPDNVPLRLHVAQLLVGLGRYGEAETEYQHALKVRPKDAQCRLGLAEVYLRQGKNSHALVIVEDLAKDPDAPAAAFVLYAKLLDRTGDERRAAAMYRRAVEADASVADQELAEELGVLPEAPDGEVPWDDDADEFGRLRMPVESGGDGPDVEMEKPDVDFAGVGGMDAVKEQIRLKIIHPIQQPELYKAYGKPIGGGILLYGPPGCGKTHLARATAGEIDAQFLAIGISDVLDMWIGNSERNLHAIFEQARDHAPCVLFFDEVDALGGARSDLRHSGARHLVNQFLAEMDGVDQGNDGLLILAATNAPWQLDAAFRRPGRFDRIVFVPPPDEPARADILRILCAGKPLDAPDFAKVARKTAGLSGADLKAVVDVAIEAKLTQALKDGIPKPLTTKDLLAAAKRVKPSTKDWFTTARNYALYSNQSGLYDDILEYMKARGK